MSVLLLQLSAQRLRQSPRDSAGRVEEPEKQLCLRRSSGLTSVRRTSEGGLIWKWDLCRCNWLRWGSTVLNWGLNPTTGIFIRRGEDTEMQGTQPQAEKARGPQKLEGARNGPSVVSSEGTWP